VSYAFNLSAHGVAVLGPVPGGLPPIGWPAVSLGAVPQLLPTAFSCFLVILAQSAATSRAYAARYAEHVDENVDLGGLALANIGAGLSGTFVVNGSPTQTRMVEGAGGRSQLAQLTASAIVGGVLLFFTGPLAYLPEAVLATVVFVIALELIDVKGLRRILAERPVEFWVALSTTASVVFIGVEQGIILAIVLSLLVHTRHGYKPRNVVLVEQEGHLQAVPVTQAVATAPGLVIYRFNHNMYYANAEQLSQEVLALAQLGPEPVTWFCIDMIAVDDVDFSTAATLRELVYTLKGCGIRLLFAEVSEPIRRELDRSEITALVGSEAFYFTATDVLKDYRQK
jgi:MFS superfamily sulfate permease-like transporter